MNERPLTDEQPPVEAAETTPTPAISGDPGSGKALLYQRALTIFATAGCTFTRAEDSGAFKVTAPLGMSEEEFQKLKTDA
jgi:hypothetical protein